MNKLTHLAMLAVGLRGEPARMPVNPAEVLQRPFADGAHLTENWGAPLPELAESGRQRFWLQPWFGLGPLKTGYLLLEDGKLQSITLYAEHCDGLESALHQDLGEPYQQGPSPQYLFSLRYARWNINGVEFVLEDFAPGCEVGIYLYQAAPAAV